MPDISTPDDKMMRRQQQDKPQPEQAREGREETEAERNETDLISNEGIGTAFRGDRLERETERALERATDKARKETDTDRRSRR